MVNERYSNRISPEQFEDMARRLFRRGLDLDGLDNMERLKPGELDKSCVRDLDLRHYSGEQLGSVRSRPAQGAKPFKPDGLWLSVGDEWERWCRDESFDLESLAYVHQITLKEDARIAVISTPDALRRFTNTYRGSELSARTDYCLTIDWGRVAKTYQGILVTPYLWGCRFEGWATWYYAWDCASGCVWDPEAIESVELMAPVTR